MKDLANLIVAKRALSPVSVADNTAQVCQVIDRQGFESLTYLIALGSLADADATFTVLLEESDVSGSGYAAVADEDMISQTAGTAPETAAGFTFAADDQVRKIAYKGNKRYTRMTITPANNASAALLAVIALLGHPDIRPVTQPTA